MKRTILLLSALLAGTMAHGAQVALTLATDVAAPRWRGGTYSVGTNALDCSAIRSGSCSLRLSTVTSPSGCASEAITPPGVLQSNTPCSASIAGQVTATSTPAGCQLTALNSLRVTFNSGVLSVFNASFDVSATFKPLTAYPITSYLVTIKGVVPLLDPASGVGKIAASFRIATNGIPNECNDPDPDYNNRKGTPTPTQNGVPAITIAV